MTELLGVVFFNLWLYELLSFSMYKKWKCNPWLDIFLPKVYFLQIWARSLRQPWGSLLLHLQLNVGSEVQSGLEWLRVLEDPNRLEPKKSSKKFMKSLWMIANCDWVTEIIDITKEKVHRILSEILKVEKIVIKVVAAFPDSRSKL